MLDRADTWIADTWVTGSRIGEIESLSVLPELLGAGVDSELHDRLEAHLHERRGYRPTWLYLSRFDGRQLATTDPE